MHNENDEIGDVFGIGGMAGGADWTPMQLEQRDPVPSLDEQLAAIHQPKPWRVALIGCGKAKGDAPAPAKDLYTGGLFRAARAHVEAGPYDAWYILSAKHGLVHPDEVIEPYDAKLGSRRAELERWASRVSRSLLSAVQGHIDAGIVVDTFAGKDYADYLGCGLSYMVRPSFTFHKPLAGLQIGERLSWFASRAAA